MGDVVGPGCNRLVVVLFFLLDFLVVGDVARVGHGVLEK
jgi:hypothetical protein